jgi:cobalt-precorrin-5B (C1)-methyltransferase
MFTVYNRDYKLKNGYTTGSCAVAACQAALELLLTGIIVKSVFIDLPGGSQVEMPVNDVCLHDGRATAAVIKDAGDDPDVTHGITVLATVELLDEDKIIIDGGPGVGRVSKPGLAAAIGEAAINPVPRQMIYAAARKVLPPGKGARIIISVPGGREVACRTMNPRLGIVDGISILGTTGIVRPMSDESYIASLLPQLDQAVALGHRVVVLTPGAMGERRARELGIDEDAVIQCSNFVGIMMEECARRKIGKILLLGHIGKMIKVAGGVMNTHSRIADARREILAAHAALAGASQEVIRKIMELNTMEDSWELIKTHGLKEVFSSLARACSRRCAERAGEEAEVGTIMYRLSGEIIAWDDKGLELGRELTCREKLW